MQKTILFLEQNLAFKSSRLNLVTQKEYLFEPKIKGMTKSLKGTDIWWIYRAKTRHLGEKNYLQINDTKVSQMHKKKNPTFQLLRLDRNFNSFSFLQISTDHTSIFINKQKFFWNDILQEKNFILQEKENIYKYLKNN